MHNCCSPFSAKLKCGDCGEYFGSKVWHSNSKYKRTIWQCNAKFKGESRCATPHLYEQRIKELFLEAVGILMVDREMVIADCRAVMEALADCGPIDAEMEAVSDEMEVTAGLIQKLVDENATRKLDQYDYSKKYDGYASRYAALESQMDRTAWEKSGRGRRYSTTFSQASLRGLARRRSCRWTSMKSCSTGLWISQRSMRTAGWFSLSAMA